MPVGEGDHIEIADVEFCVGTRNSDAPADSMDALKKTAQVVETLEHDWVLSQFHELLATEAIIPHYQRIVDFETEQSVGWEALARTALTGLESPLRMFETARLVHRETELSLICRDVAVRRAEWLPAHKALFLNTHPTESLVVDVLPSICRLKKVRPDVTLVVEIHEGAIQNLDQMREVVDRLHDVGAKVAYDDFGAGQSRLLELMNVPPDFLKFDRGLIQDLHNATPHQTRIMRMLVEMAHDVGITTIARRNRTRRRSSDLSGVGNGSGSRILLRTPGLRCELSQAGTTAGGFVALPSSAAEVAAQPSELLVLFVTDTSPCRMGRN